MMLKTVKIWLLLVISIAFLTSPTELICAYDEITDVALLAEDRQEQNFGILINEIHYDPDVKTEPAEFVELHNTTGNEVNLSGWYFNDGISYRFPAGAMLPANGYIVVAMDPVHVQVKWDLPLNLVFGPFEGKLSNEGEQIELCNADGEIKVVNNSPIIGNNIFSVFETARGGFIFIKRSRLGIIKRMMGG